MKKLLLFLLTLGLISFGFCESVTAEEEDDVMIEESFDEDEFADESMDDEDEDEEDDLDDDEDEDEEEEVKKGPTLYDIRKAIVERHSRNKWYSNYESRWYREEVVVEKQKKSYYNYVIVEKSKKSSRKRETLYKVEMDGETPMTVEVRLRGKKIVRARKIKEFIRRSYNPPTKEEKLAEKKAIAEEEQNE